jgi:hypothetical protein
MLTLAKVEIYGRFKGDIDGFARSDVDPSISGITHRDWWQIAELRQALGIIASGMASPDFVAETERQLVAATDNDHTRAAIRELRE